MDRINLIPKQRRLNRQRQVRVRLWIGAVVSYSVLALLAGLIYGAIASPKDLNSLNEEIAEMQDELAQIQQKQTSLKPKLSEQKLILAAGLSITDQPDWSLLLSYLADEVLGENIVLNGCTLTPEKESADAQDYQDVPLVLTISGYAKTTPDVSQFVLRLEQMSLFNKVKLTKTNLEPFLKNRAIAFEARCMLDPGEGGQSE